MSESKITVDEATHVIQRCTNRLALLLEAESVSTGLNYWGKIGHEEKRETVVNPLSNVGFTVLMDLEEVYGRNLPEYATWRVKEKTKHLPSVEWTGPDLSCELCRPMEELDFLYGALSNTSFDNSSEAAAQGAFTIAKDVQDQLLEILDMLKQEKAA